MQIAVLVTMAGIFTSAGADTREIGRLRQQDLELQVECRRLQARRDSVVVSADALSARIDSLKDKPSAAEQLQDALRSSLVLVQDLMGIDRRLEQMRSRRDSVRERLRVAYDWEIGRLIQQLNGNPDPGLLAQLMVYQQDRESLGSQPVSSELRYGENMAINPSDGPDEIRQKMELMEDIAARLRAEARHIRSKLKRLEEEERLRVQTGTLARQAGTSRGKGRRDAQVSSAMYGQTPVLLGPAPAGRPGRGMTAGEGPRVLPLAGAEDVALEIRKLRAHQQEVRQLEAVARERAARFRVYLKKMLEGGK